MMIGAHVVRGSFFFVLETDAVKLSYAAVEAKSKTKSEVIK